MDNFYYNLLNIGKEKLADQKYFDIVNRIIEEETNNLKIDNYDLKQMRKIISTNIDFRLQELNISSKIINTKTLFNIFEHQFIISSYINLEGKINYVLIDPTYVQFINKNEYDYKTVTPVDILKKEEKGKKLLDNLLCLGFSIIDDDDIKLYISSILYGTDMFYEFTDKEINVTINDLIMKGRYNENNIKWNNK